MIHFLPLQLKVILHLLRLYFIVFFSFFFFFFGVPILVITDCFDPTTVAQMDSTTQQGNSDLRSIQNSSSQTEPEKGEENNIAQQRTDNATPEGKFSYGHWLHKKECEKEADETKKQHLALTWTNLEVTGVDSRAVLGQNVLSLINPFELLRNVRPSGTVVSWPNTVIAGRGTDVFSSTDDSTPNERTVEARGNGKSLTRV
jgi:hypothetical protein